MRPKTALTLARLAAIIPLGAATQAQAGAPIKIDLILPATGTLAALGGMIENDGRGRSAQGVRCHHQHLNYAAGLKQAMPLYGPGFLTRGTLDAPGAAAQGLLTASTDADNLDTPRNNTFCKSSALTYRANADVYAVKGYDAAQILAAGLTAVKGRPRPARRADHRHAHGHRRQPRGKFTLSPAGNPVQDFFLREVKATTTDTAPSRSRRWPIRRGGQAVGTPHGFIAFEDAGTRSRGPRRGKRRPCADNIPRS